MPASPLISSSFTQPPLTVVRPSPKDRSAKELLPWLPCTLALEVPLVGFKVASLLGLAEGSIVRTACNQSSDIPLKVNGVLLGWTEFEVVGERLAARITELA